MRYELAESARPLTSIEKYHLLSDSAASPNLIFSRLRFRGFVNRSILQKAARIVRERHPFSRQVVNRNDWSWVDANDDSVIVECEQGIPTQIRPIDLVANSGVRVYIHSSGDETIVMAPAHHACVDGPGAIGLINELFHVYSNLVHGLDPYVGLPRLKPELLGSRNVLGLATGDYLRHWYKQPIAAIGAAKFLFRSFYELGSPGPEQTRFPAVTGMWLGEQHFDALESWSQKSGLLKNSLMLGVFFQVLREFVLKGKPELEKCLRIIIPMSMRDRKHLRMPAANRATIVQIDRGEAELRDESTFYYYLDREVRLIRGWRFDRLFPIIVRSMSVSSQWLSQSAQNPKSRGTAIFTNLGEPWRWARKKGWQSGEEIQFGDVAMVDYDLVGPVRPGTPLNLTAQKHGRGYRISAHWDDRQLNKKEVDQILNGFADRLLEWVRLDV